MAECPFCKGSISEDLATYGGRCTHCLIEIPGEEAPTNPGADAQARQAAEEAAASSGRRRRVVLAAAALFMLGIGGTAAAVLLAPEQPELSGGNDFDDFVMVPLDKHKSLEVEQAEAAVAANQGARSGRRGSTGQRSTQGGGSNNAVASAGTGTGAGTQPAAGSNTEEGTQSASILGTGIKSSSASGIGLDLGTGPSVSVVSKGPEAIVLKDTEAIREMVQTVLKTGGSSLKACYESEIKTDETLRGTWEISFSLNRSGKAQAIEIQPLSTSNPDLEACMASKVSKWSFVAIENPIRIVKNFSFQSGW